MTDYALRVSVPTDFAETVRLVRAALAEQGFGVLTEIDIAATMKAKLGLDLPPHLILGACNPPLAARALAAEPTVGVLLPCNVVVRAGADGETMVEAMNPAVMSQLTDSAEVAAVAEQALERITVALATLPKNPA